MNQPFPHQKLMRQGSYTEQGYVQTQAPTYLQQPTTYPQQMLHATYSQQTLRPGYPSPYSTSRHSHNQRVAKRRKKLLFPLLVLLFVLLVATMSGLYHLLTSNDQTYKSIQQTLSQGKTQGSSSNTQGSSSQSALKDVAQAKINQFAADVDKIKQAGRNVTTYQQKLDQDRSKLSALSSQQDYIGFFIQVASDITPLQGDLAGNSPSTLLSNFKQEAQQWGNANKYHDPYDGKDYYLNSSYLSIDGHNGNLYGESAYMSDEVNAGNPNASQDIKDDDFSLAMLEANYEDTTPYNQPHHVDKALLNYFGDQQKRVMIVSLTEQAARIYNNGTLEQAFQVTTGREYRPTPVGHYQLTHHFYNITLTSYDSPSSPDYYTPVVVQNAIQFWDNGYLIHSSPWRKDYGPDTQFPHKDSGGDPQASVGSHGCVNIPPVILSKLDATITNGMPLLIF